jgi:hypothetical protein
MSGLRTYDRESYFLALFSPQLQKKLELFFLA